MTHRSVKIYITFCISLSFFACAGPYTGPDKQFAGGLEGAAVGAGAGAVTGFQVGSGTGPGALVGAGFGAIAGGIRGYTRDEGEEAMLALAARSQRARETSYAQEVLSEHFRRRMELHPTRDIFPADLFFHSDTSELNVGSRALTRELYELNKDRLPWSRLGVRAYVKSVDKDSYYAKRLAENRARVVSDYLVQLGMEPRRLVAQGVVVSVPLVRDPHDRPQRYSQAIEFIPLDR